MPRFRDQELLDQIGAHLQRLRQDRGHTQEALAELVNIQPESPSRAESGARALSLSTFARVSRALDVGLGDLLDASRPRPEPTSSPEDVELQCLWTRIAPTQRCAILRLLREAVALTEAG
ncbi:MAG: helix-turn-helix transcriptional regulator [Armatimonadetes bacterium]|nr:helix-turn-helix transcriptional regulator [Armatimonadota bacterium]